MNLNILSHFASMKVLKVEIRIFGKSYAVKPHSTSLWEFFGSVGCLTPISNIRKKYSTEPLEFEMCNLELERHN